MDINKICDKELRRVALAGKPSIRHPGVQKAINDCVDAATDRIDEFDSAEDAMDGGSYSPSQQLLEDISDIARREGWEDEEDLWNEAANAALRQVERLFKKYRQDRED